MGRQEQSLAIKAVIFDYGMVLTGEPNPQAYAEMLRITGMSREQFEPLYWADRHAYDEGKLNGITFWQKFLRDAKLELPEGTVDELNAQDAQYWTTENPRMVAWQSQLKKAGIKTAILSNMGDAVHESIEAAFPWIQNFDYCTWSYQLGCAKPEPRIYLHTLKELGVQADEALFIDDKLANIEAARKLGINTIHFSTIENLREELIVDKLDQLLPLPV
jgi:putative hydrolase of the HAD superfamily